MTFWAGPSVLADRVLDLVARVSGLVGDVALDVLDAALRAVLAPRGLEALVVRQRAGGLLDTTLGLVGLALAHRRSFRRERRRYRRTRLAEARPGAGARWRAPTHGAVGPGRTVDRSRRREILRHPTLQRRRHVQELGTRPHGRRRRPDRRARARGRRRPHGPPLAEGEGQGRARPRALPHRARQRQARTPVAPPGRLLPRSQLAGGGQPPRGGWGGEGN